jgi:hypothetical protein
MSTPSHPNRRRLLAGGLALLAASLGAQAQQQRAPVLVEVWKDPNCGCCKDWVSHLESNGFRVKVNDTGNNAIRGKLGVDRKYGSCHTALVGGYAIEGHVPAREIQRLLQEKPQAVGLAVPGMPVGSPGMDGKIYGDRRDEYDVLLLAKDGGAKVYQHYEGTKVSQRDGASAKAADLVEAEVRKVDKANRKITLKHGPIRNLDMPPMTMVFQVEDAALLDKVKAGDKVRFAASGDGGKYTVTDIQPLK